MKVSQSTIVILVLVGLLAIPACSSHKSPIEPDDPSRTVANFNSVHTDFLDGTFTESDLSPLVNGPVASTCESANIWTLIG